MTFPYTARHTNNGDPTRKAVFAALVLFTAANLSDGKTQQVSHASLTVRPGGTTFDSVQLATPPPGIATTRAGVMKTAPTTAANDRPTESINFNYGQIRFTYKEQKTDFQFTGGTLVNGNLRVSRASYTGAVHPQ